MEDLNVSLAPRPGRVLLVEDNDVLRRGLAQMIGRERDLAVVGEAASRTEALELMARRSPDIALVDLGLKRGDSLALVRDLRRHRRGFPVMLLTRRDDDRQTERALRAGARGLVSKWATTQAVAAAIRVVLAGGVHLPPGGAPGATQPTPTRDDVHRLVAPRELEVLRLLARGFNSSEIAAELGLNTKTVEVYLSNARRKLGLPGFMALHHLVRGLFAGEADAAAGGGEPGT
jgi:two-component system response regulator DevR